MRADDPCPNNGKKMIEGCPYCGWWHRDLEWGLATHPRGRQMSWEGELQWEREEKSNK